MREFVLNETSFRHPFGTIQEAKESVCSILDGMAQLVNKKIVEKVLRNNGTFHSQIIADGKTLNAIIQLLLRNPQTKDFAGFFLAMAHKSPVDAVTENEILNRISFLDMSSTDADKLALLLCWASQHILVSLPTEEMWNTDLLQIDVQQLDEHAEIQNTQEQIDNVANAAHAAAIIDRHASRVCNNLSQQDFWNKKIEVFPNLDFGLDVESQVLETDVSSYGQFITALRELNTTCARWQIDSRPHPQYQAKRSGESQSTMQQLSGRRSFRNKDGQSVVYETHIKIGNSLRIYFLEDYTHKRIEIGYLGRHLPTATQRT